MAAGIAEPKLTIPGVYRPQISPETWQEPWNVTGDDHATRDHFAKLVLIESIVESSFGQMQVAFPDNPRYMQVGWMARRSSSGP